MKSAPTIYLDANIWSSQQTTFNALYPLFLTLQTERPDTFPRNAELPPGAIAHTVLDVFEQRCSWQKIVDPQLFIRDLQDAVSEKRSNRRHYHFSAMLLSAILAFGLAFSSKELYRSPEYRKRYAQHAKSLLEEECQSPALCTVQAVAILSVYHSGVAEQGESLGIRLSRSDSIFLLRCQFHVPWFVTAR